MPAVTLAEVQESAQEFRALFFQTLEEKAAAEEERLKALAMINKTSEERINYKYIKSFPQMRLWVGDRLIHHMLDEGYDIRQLPWELTISIDKNDHKYDRVGVVAPALRNMSDQAARIGWRRVVYLLRNSFTDEAGVSIDGLPFFSASHETGSNYGTDQFDATALDVALTAFSTQKNPEDQGENSLDIVATHLWFANEIQSSITDVLGKEFLTGGESNKHYGKLAPFPVNGMPDSLKKAWGLFDLSKELKPFIWQYDPDDINFTVLNQPSDLPVFMQRQFLYGVDKVGNAAWGCTQVAWGSDGTGS